MSNVFDQIATQYQKKSLVQQKAADKLLKLLNIKSTDKVLDVGCGPGHITNAIGLLNSQNIVGTDISAGMIEQAKMNYPLLNFRQVAADDLDYQNEFDIIFCNSTFQWFTKPEKAVQAMRQALKPGGRIGIACPGTTSWSPWMIKIIAAITQQQDIAPTFKTWQSPWTFLSDQKAYQDFFEKQKLQTNYITVDYENNLYTIEQAYNIYLSGAANGFVGKEYYSIKITDEYVNKFNQYVKAEIVKNSIDGFINVDFKRFYYIGLK